ncbi:CvpA family protein [Prosthecobacter sp.]|uniref:CvpA family protein n=1 Tax=Prosthecobacter sp. TaxID=1965333 RepID=UPI002ABB6E6D|nr:CvpA family protein [Prosthecobacter sp.]MDZ4401603.1 CvpA family protein [Prosthecobacter sp.]
MPNPSEVLQTVQKVPSSMWATIGIVGFIAFAAGLAFSRGVVKQLLGAVTLAVSVGAAWYVFRHRVQIFGAAGINITTDRLLMLSVAAGLLTYFLCKMGTYFLAAFGLLKMLGGLDGWKGLIISFLPSGALLWIGSMVLRLVGSLYGMENAAEIVKKGGEVGSQAKSFWYSLSQRIDNSFLGGVAKRLDPYDIKPTANLARLLILWPEGSMWQQLAAQNPAAAQALNHPRIVELGYDPAVRKAIDNRDFAGLMQMRKVEETANHPDLQPVLGGLALEQAMDSVVYQRPQPVRLN